VATAVRAFPWARIAVGLWLTLAVGVVVAAAAGWPLPGALAATLGLLLVSTVGVGVFHAQLGLFARPIVAADPREAGDRIALTFDDGPEPGTTEQVLALLRARGHRATFFVIGRRAEAARGLARQIVREGHGLANHSFAHRPATPFLRPRVLAAELAQAEALLGALRGEAPAGPWFRAPVGIVSPRVAEAARLAGLELVGWTASARDGTRRMTVDRALARLRPCLRPGAILVLHDGVEGADRRPIAPVLLARLLDELDARKLRSVTLDELLGGPR